MKAKKYQFYNRFLVKDPATERNIFGFRELKKTACWIMVDPLDDSGQSENSEWDLDQVLNDFARNPTMSETRLKQYLVLTRQRLKSDSQSTPPGMLMMVTDYSRIVWAIAGDLRMYRVRKGSLKFEDDDRHLLDYLAINAKTKEVRSNSAFLKDNDLFFLRNAQIGQKISDEFLYRTITDYKNCDESAEKAIQLLIDASQDPDYRMAFISINKLIKRDLGHDLKDCKRNEVMIPVLLMACFGMLAIYEIESQKMKHALFIPNTIAQHQKQLAARKIKAALPVTTVQLQEASDVTAANIGQPANDLELTNSSSVTIQPLSETTPPEISLKNMTEDVTETPEKGQPVVVANLQPVQSTTKIKPESTTKPAVSVQKTEKPTTYSESSITPSKGVTLEKDHRNVGTGANLPQTPENSNEQYSPEIPVIQPDPEMVPLNVPGESDPTNGLPEDSAQFSTSNAGGFAANNDLTGRTQSQVDSKMQPKPNQATEYANPEKTGGVSQPNEVTIIEKEIVPETVADSVTVDL